MIVCLSYQRKKKVLQYTWLLNPGRISSWMPRAAENTEEQGKACCSRHDSLWSDNRQFWSNHSAKGEEWNIFLEFQLFCTLAKELECASPDVGHWAGASWLCMSRSCWNEGSIGWIVALKPRTLSTAERQTPGGSKNYKLL